MCKSGRKYTDDIGDEKIGDSINYLLLLRAVVADDREDAAEPDSESVVRGEQESENVVCFFTIPIFWP
jgi:hypothetical protein